MNSKSLRVFFAFSPAQNWRRLETIIRAGEAMGLKLVGALTEDEVSGSLKGDDARIQRYIDECIENSEITIVLLDTHTSSDKWVRYAVQQNHKKHHGLLAVHIHNVPDESGQRSKIGNDRFGELDPNVFFWQRYSTYRWVIDDGSENLFKWIEKASLKTA